MTMKKKAPIFFQVRPGDSLASSLIGIEGSCPQHNVFAVECAIALTNRHGSRRESYHTVVKRFFF